MVVVCVAGEYFHFCLCWLKQMLLHSGHPSEIKVVLMLKRLLNMKKNLATTKRIFDDGGKFSQRSPISLAGLCVTGKLSFICFRVKNKSLILTKESFILSCSCM